MVIVKKQGNQEPERITHRIKLGMKQFTLAFDVHQADDENSYEWSEATLDLGTPSYSEIAAAIIKSRYDDNDMQAIINNHLLEDDNAEHEKEWKQMQEWRATAKEMAKEFLLELENA